MAEMTGTGTGSGQVEVKPDITSRCFDYVNEIQGLLHKNLYGMKPAELERHHAQIANCKRKFREFAMKNLIKDIKDQASVVLHRETVIPVQNIEGNFQTRKRHQAQEPAGVEAGARGIDTDAGSTKARVKPMIASRPRYLEYVDKMEELLFQNLDGMEPAELELHQAQVANCKREFHEFTMKNLIKGQQASTSVMVQPETRNVAQENGGSLQTKEGRKRKESVRGKVGAGSSKAPTPAEETEEESQKEKRRLEQRLNDLSTVMESEEAAIKQIRQFLPDKAQFWIITRLQPSNVDKYPTLYDHFLKEILEENWRSAVKPQFWDMFVRDVNKRCEVDCSNYLKMVFEPALKFANDLKKQIVSQGGFSSEKCDQLALELKVKCEGINATSEILPLMELALGKIAMVYRMANQRIPENEVQLMESLSLQLKNFYDDEMKRYFQENGIFAKKDLGIIHCILVQKLVDAGKNVLSPPSSADLPEKVLSWAKAIEDGLDESFQKYFDSNNAKARMVEDEVGQLIALRFEEYTDNMEGLVRIDGGVNLRELTLQHVTTANAQLELLDSGIKKRFGVQEPTGVHLEALGRGILKFWSFIREKVPKLQLEVQQVQALFQKANEANLRKRRGNQMQKDARELDRRRPKEVKATQTQQKTKQNPKLRAKPGPAKATAGPSKSHECNDNAGFNARSNLNGRITLSPLVFRLTDQFISMGCHDDNGKFSMIRNESGELLTPVVVATDVDKKLVYGNKAVGSDQCWHVTDYLGNGDEDSLPRQKLDFKAGDSDSLKTCEVSVEFLLGFILRCLKDTAEEHYNGRFTAAVITIPFWFCSGHRIIVKEAGLVAGFTEVYLVNEESAVAYHAASSQPRDSRGNLMMMSENFGVISGVIYSYTDGKQRKISMTCAYHAAAGNGKKMRTLVTGRDVEESNDRVVKEVGKKLLDHYYSKKIQRSLGQGDDKVILITQSCNERDAEWLRIFNKAPIGKSYDRGTLGLKADEEDCGVLKGAGILSLMPDKIGECVRDLLAEDVMTHCLDSEASSSKAIPKEKVNPLPIKNQHHPIELQRSVKKVQFYQSSVIGDKRLKVGELRVGPSVSKTQQVFPVLKLSNEGIVTLAEVKVSAGKGRGGNKKLTKDYIWKPFSIPNDNVRQQITKDIDALVKAHKEVDSEVDPELFEARGSLLIKTLPRNRGRVTLKDFRKKIEKMEETAAKHSKDAQDS